MSASIDIYRNVNVGTTSPRQVILKLYDVAIRNLTEAEEALAQGRPAAEPLKKVQAVIGGLMTALDFDAGDLSQKLLQLYLFVLDRVQAASASNRDSGLGDARRVLETVQSGWAEIPADEARQSVRPTGESRGFVLKG